MMQAVELNASQLFKVNELSGIRNCEEYPEIILDSSAGTSDYRFPFGQTIVWDQNQLISPLIESSLEHDLVALSPTCTAYHVSIWLLINLLKIDR
jgi:hypothetical protein